MQTQETIMRKWVCSTSYLRVYLCALVIANKNIFFVVLVLVMDVVVDWCILIHFISSKRVSASKKTYFIATALSKKQMSCGGILRITLLSSWVSKETMNTALEVIYRNDICAVTYIVPIWLYFQKYLLLFANFRSDCS